MSEQRREATRAVAVGQEGSRMPRARIQLQYYGSFAN